ncbi:MAG: dynamin family protein [Akkermansia sp.]|nr:dynamin family protein [Akkermansia sp.]
MFENYEETRERACRFLETCIKAAKEMNENNLAKQLETGILDLRSLHFNIAVVGDIKRGKSTLINTLLGQKTDALSPIDSEVCTGAITHYMDLSCLKEENPQPHARVYIGGEPEPRKISLYDIADYVTESSNPNNRRNVVRIEVYGHFPLLHSCCLVDTPGANAVIERHGELVHGFLPKADAIIMTVMSSQPMTSSEAAMVRELSQDAQRRVFYVLTQIDTECPEDLDMICDYVSEQISKNGLSKPSCIHRIACKPVFDALKRGAGKAEVDVLREKWGVASLEKELEQFILASSENGKLLTKRVSELVTNVRKVFSLRRQSNEDFLHLHDIDTEDLEREREHVLGEFKKSKANIENNIKRFTRRWDSVTERTAEQLPILQSELEQTIETAIDQAGMLGALKNSFTLGSVIQKQSRPAINRFLSSLSNKYKDLIEELDSAAQEEIRMFTKVVSSSSYTSGGAGLAVASLATYSCANAFAAGSAVMTAATAWATASTTAAAAVAQQGALASAWTWLVGAETAGTAAGAATSAAGAAQASLVASIGAAVVPIVIAIIALKLTGPLAKYFTKFAIPGKVDTIVNKIKDDIHTSSEKYMQHIVSSLREQLDTLQEDMKAKIKELDARRRDPESKEKAINENKKIADLLELGNETENSAYSLR